ncbi:hypothetical protein [Qipengyuania sp.]|uniref:hypothetical protein n=1 Tax=Qipengyuania sp. TaxID=2004515 RepID=UPI0035C7D6F8
MTGKVPQGGMPEKENENARKSGDGEVDGIMPRDKRGAGGGGPIGPKGAGKHRWHGGQSNAAYHGSGQLGEEDVESQGNANSPSEDP